MKKIVSLLSMALVFAQGSALAVSDDKIPERQEIVQLADDASTEPAPTATLQESADEEQVVTKTNGGGAIGGDKSMKSDRITISRKGEAARTYML